MADTDPWAAAGVMVREDRTPSARNVFLGITSGHGIEFQARLATDDITHFIAGDALSAPYWLKLARVGDLFTGYSSIDGLNWTIVGSYTNGMSTDATIGLAVTARNNTLLNTSAFSDVQISFTPANTPPTISDIGNHSAVANTPTTPIAFKIGDNETPAEDLDLAGYSSNPTLVPAGAFRFGGYGVDRIAIITPAANQWGSATVTVTVTDANGGSASDSFLLTVLADTDADGMPDVWELANGLSPSWSGDASIDSDGDGFTNLEEFLAGTDPHNPAEFPVIIETQDIANNDVQIKFRTVIDRTYRVERSDTFPSLNWTVVTDGISGTGGILEITDVGGANHAKSFYRVAVSP